MRQSRSIGKFVGSCKICKLLKSHPDIWVEAHDRVLVQDLSMRSTRIWLNEQLKWINLEAKDDSQRLNKFSDQNFVNHFSGKTGGGGHCKDRIQATLQMRGELPSKKAPLVGDEHFTASEYSVADAFFLDMPQELTEYASMDEMILTLEALLEITDKGLKEDIAAKKNIPLIKVEQYQKQVTALMALKEKMITFRNTSKLTGRAIESTSTMTVELFLGQLMTVTEEAYKGLQSEFPASRYPDEVIGMIRDKMGKGMKELVQEIHKRITTQYRVK